MVERLHRCAHCKAPYTWQASGEGCFEPLNDQKYCADCKKVVLEALMRVPKRFKPARLDQTEIALDQAEGHYQEQMRIRAEQNGGLVSRRVMATVFRKGEAKVFNIIEGFGPHKGKTLVYEYWPSERHEGTVQLFAQEDLITGKKTACEEFGGLNEAEKYMWSLPKNEHGA